MTCSPKLEKCPFCNSSNLSVMQFGIEEAHEKPEDSVHGVVCEGCGGAGPEVRPRTAAIEAWNNRPPSRGEIHWKANHDTQIQKSRILMDRRDMPLERVRAYSYVTGMELRIERLKEQIERLGGVPL